MSHIFISHSREDLLFVTELKTHLRNAGFKSWVDSEELRAGDLWRDVIDEAIKDSFALIVVLSPNTKNSEYITYEWVFAWANGIPIIPIILKETDLHPRLQSLHYIDFSSPWPSPPWEKIMSKVRGLETEFMKNRGIGNLIRGNELNTISFSPFLFARLGIPAALIEGDGSYEYRDTIDPQTVQYVWDPTPYTLEQLPDDIRDLCKRVFEERRQFADNNDKPFYNGRLARVVDYQPLRDDRTGFRGMRLRLQHTDYYTFISTNHASESSLSKEVYKSSLFESEKEDPRNLRKSVLSNGLTVSINVIIEDENHQRYLLVQKRNVAKITHSFSTWQCSAAGSINMPADTGTTYPNPFFSAIIREVKEETGIILKPSDIAILALVRDTRYFEPALIAQAVVKGQPHRILQQIEDSFESTAFETLLLTPDTCTKFLLRIGQQALKSKKKKIQDVSERDLILAAIDDYAANAMAAFVLTLLHEFRSLKTVETVEGIFRVL